jgi:hypothetical protein
MGKVLEMMNRGRGQQNSTWHAYITRELIRDGISAKDKRYLLDCTEKSKLGRMTAGEYESFNSTIVQLLAQSNYDLSSLR